MWERFTEKARRVIVLAQEEATRLGHGYVGTEHILMGLIQSKDNGAVKILDSMKVNLEVLRNGIENSVIKKNEPSQQEKVFTHRAKKAFELAFNEAKYNNARIDTEHLLIGLVRERESIAAQVLSKLGVTAKTISEHVGYLLGPEWVTFETPEKQAQLCPHCGKDIHEPPEEKKEEQGGA